MRRSQRTAMERAIATFTLVELLVVMLIVIMLMAAALPTVLKVASGSSVEAASRMVGAQLRLARQEAITRRRHVAVMFPTTNSTAGDKVAYVAFRSCFVTSVGGAFEFDEWVPNVDWTFCPVGAVLAEADDDGPTPGNAPNLVDDTITLVDDNAASELGFGGSVRAIVFRPTGRLANFGERNVTLVEGALPVGASMPTIKQRTNWINIQTDQYTGRVLFQRPEDIL